jgi:hypothetical protein
MQMVVIFAGLVVVAALAHARADGDRSETGKAPARPAVAIDPRRSLVVTEEKILAPFSYQRVLEQLVAQSRVPGMTALGLHQQWWDTQNPGPGLGLGPHCDDDDLVTHILNGFPYTCRPAPLEGAQAGAYPFDMTVEPNPDSYIPIGLFNRFDLAPADGAHCGEYRIVFAKRSGQIDGRQRNLVIFEAVLPNPHPQQGLKGCRKVVDFWADLSREDDLERRADLLERFYFEGVKGMEPVVHVDHFGGNPGGFGQIRSNQFLNAITAQLGWSLREFKLLKDCDGRRCTSLIMVPGPDKVNPFGPLFSSMSTRSAAVAFQEFFPVQVAALAANDLTGIDFDPPDEFNTGQSQASINFTRENDYLFQFEADTKADVNSFRHDIEKALAAIGSSLTANQIVLRAQALSCAGCHALNNNVEVGGGLIWPTSLGFTHVSEREIEEADGVTRFKISPALVDVFLPKRQQILEDFLTDKPIRVRKQKDPIGNRRTH